MSTFDCVFFDSGGTLYGVFDGGTKPSLKQMMEKRVERVSWALRGYVAERPEDLESVIVSAENRLQRELGPGYNYHRLMIAALRDLQLDLGDEVAACLADAYAGPRYADWLFPGTKEMLQALTDAGLYIGVIANTAWPGFCMDRAFAGVGLLPYFKTRFYSGDLGIEKPDPAFFRHAEQVAGQGGKRILYVGDSVEKDIKGAKGVGWSAALRRSSAKSSGGLADFEFDHCEEITAFILGS